MLQIHASLVLYSPTALIDVQNVSRFLEIAHDATYKKVVHIFALTHLKMGKHQPYTRSKQKLKQMPPVYRVNAQPIFCWEGSVLFILAIGATRWRVHRPDFHILYRLQRFIRNKVSLRAHPPMISKAHILVEFRLHILLVYDIYWCSVCQKATSFTVFTSIDWMACACASWNDMRCYCYWNVHQFGCGDSKMGTSALWK